MKIALALGIVGALVLHAAVLTFGGIFFLQDENPYASVQPVDLMSAEEVAAEEKKQEEPKPEEASDAEQLETSEEQAPDAEELIRNMELSAAAAMPELEAASLSDLADALSGQSGGSTDFGEALDLAASGGRIGGKGKAGAISDTIDNAFSLADIDQKPRVIYQAAPNYPSTMRGRKVEGVVSVLFVVDANGKVDAPRIEKSSNVVFEKPALDSVKNWKFEPAIKAGQRVSCKMRVQVRFPPS